MTICLYVYKFIKYIWYGLLWPIIFIVVQISKLIIKKRELNVEKLKEESQKIYEKELKKEKKRKKEKFVPNNYKNENLKLEKKSLGYYINEGLMAIISIPKRIKNKFDNISVVKQARNKRAFDTKTMLVDFAAEDAKDKDEKARIVTWEYIAINQNGKKVKG